MNTTTIPKAINVTSLRNDLKNQLDRVTNDNILLIVQRNNDKNVVILSEEEYSNLLTNLNDLKYHLKLLESAKQADNNETFTILHEDFEQYE